MLSYKEWAMINEHKRGTIPATVQSPTITDELKQGITISTQKPKPRKQRGRRITTHQTSKNQRRLGTRDARNRAAMD
jgi:hypothetical protein